MGLPRVEELFEARVPKGTAIICEIDGISEIVRDPDGSRGAADAPPEELSLEDLDDEDEDDETAEELEDIADAEPTEADLSKEPAE